MSTSDTIQLYDLLRVKLGESEARSVAMELENRIRENSAQNRSVLSTPPDGPKARRGIFWRMAESRSEMNKWMSIFFIAGIGLEIAIVIAFAEGLLR